MSSEVKQRKKNVAGGKQSDGAREQPARGKVSEGPVRNALCLLSLLASAAMAGLMFQQSAKFADVEQKYQQLYMKSVAAQALEDEINKVSKKCESAQEIMSKLKDHSLLKQVEYLQTEIMKMKIWSSSLTEKRNKLDEKLVSLSDTIDRIDKNTVQISSDVTTKLSGVRTDIRRISGLDSDISLLKDSLRELENKVNNVEKTTVHNIGNLIATSVERVTQLKNMVSGNTDRIELLQKKLTELKVEDINLSDRLLSLEDSRAKLVKAVMFANDLKPKVYNVRKSFSLLEPQINDLIGRIGQISSDLLKRNEELANLRKELANCTEIANDSQSAKDCLSQVTTLGQ
ncbi:inhibitor of nuclear factor kappa-B kinase-interacting protein isoform X1 [Chiloscyllium punctatum]|uniref:inhibitor of nuclear factor kappa-B kinase-interacting protein isoform X1 n=2 Tax=Chiloscyllium punctatum TaxID=137246 RepID=UPI003B636385